MAWSSKQLIQSWQVHSSRTKLTLPVRSVVEEYKVAKARSFMKLRDSKGHVVKNIQTDVKSGRKLTASAAVEGAESRLKHKGMVGATQLGRQGISLTPHKWWSTSTAKEQRVLVTQEIREAEEERRLAKAVIQAKQGASVEQWSLAWDVLWQIGPKPPHGVSFSCRSTYMTFFQPL